MNAPEARYVAHDIPELLDLLPALFGFVPAESFIAIATDGERAKLGFRLRMDIPPPEQVAAAAVQVASYLRRQRPTGVILIALTEKADVADELMTACLAELDDLRVDEAVRASADHYWRYRAGIAGKPVRYHPGCGLAVADAVLSGRPIFANRQALAAKFAAVTGARKERLTLAADRALRSVAAALAGSPNARHAAIGMAVLAPIIEGFSADRQLSEDELAALAVWVSSTPVRDAVWSGMDTAGAQRSLELWTQVAQAVPVPFEPPVLSLAGFAAWLTGDGTQALIAIERALAAQPGYRMAGLILELIQSAIPPREWEEFHRHEASAS